MSKPKIKRPALNDVPDIIDLIEQVSGDDAPVSPATFTSAGFQNADTQPGGSGGDYFTLAKAGETALVDDVTLSEGYGVLLTQAAQDIEIAVDDLWPTRPEWNQNGFDDRTLSTLTWTDTGPDRTLSIQPTGTDFNYWVVGVKYTATGDTVQIDNTEGVHAIYYDGATLTALANPTVENISDLIRNYALVSFIYWDASTPEGNYIGEERHAERMSPDTHAYLHFALGLQYFSGLGLNTFSVDGGGATADAQFGVDVGAVADEDIYLPISAVLSTTGLPVYHLDGADGNLRQTVVAGFSARTFDNTSADRLAWNEYTGGAWQLTEADSGKYVLYHVFATTEKDKPMISLMGQATYGNKPAAREGAKTEVLSLVTNDILLPEIRPIATVIYQTNTAYASAINARIVSTDEGDDYIDWRSETISRVEVSTSDHGQLSGLDAGNRKVGNHTHAVQRYTDTSPPDANDDNVGTGGNGTFFTGDTWVDTATDIAYKSVDDTATAAVWDQINVASLWQRNGVVLSPATADDTVEIPNATDDEMFKLTYTGADVSGPTITFEHDSATQANNDILGELLFSGNNSTPAMTDYVRLRAYSENVIAGSEDGGLGIEMQVDSTFKSVLDLWPDRAVINEDGVDIDFRVEGENDINLIYTDASKDRIGISTATPAGVLDINGNDSATEKGYTVRIERDLVDAETDKPVVEIIQDDATDTENALSVRCDGPGYGLSIDSVKISTWADLDELGSTPANPAADDWRVYALADGLYYLEDDGTETGPLGVNYWQRIGTALTPATVNDRIEVVSSDTGPIVGEYTGTVNDGRAMLGQATGATGETIGVEGVCASADNAAYEGKFPRVVSDNWHDMGESSNTPLSDAPEAGYVRAIAGDDGRLYAIDSDANRHDLTQRTPHYFAGWTAAQNAATGKTWDSLKYPATAVAIGTVTASNTGGFDFTNEGGLTSFGRWTWQANVVFADPDYIQSNQSQVAVWSPFGRQGDNNDNCRVYVQARIRVNTVANFDNVYLVVNDVTTADVLANTAKSADQLGSMSDGVWYIATLAAAGTDVGGWNECLRAGVWAQGASEVALEDITLQLDIDWIKVYMYAD